MGKLERLIELLTPTEHTRIVRYLRQEEAKGALCDVERELLEDLDEISPTGAE